MEIIKFGLLTVSDGCYYNRSEEIPDSLLELDLDLFQSVLKSYILHVFIKSTVRNEKNDIKRRIMQWTRLTDVILTIGGTGFSKRDVTPEATKEVIRAECPGILMEMITSTLKKSPMAMFNRSVCGILDGTLIINLPGSLREARECLSAIISVIPRAVKLIKRKTDEIRSMQLDNLGYTRDRNVMHPRKSSSFAAMNRKRDREPAYPMISVDEAKGLMLKKAEFVRGIEVRELDACLDKILATDVHSKRDLPWCRTSIKDGYAVLAGDGTGARIVLTGIRGETATHIKLRPGTCMRVNAGAPIPANAFAVVPVEDTKFIEGSSDTKESKIEITTQVHLAQNIKFIGDDIRKDDRILEKSTKLGALQVGLAAVCRVHEVIVTYDPIVGVLSIGDELQRPGQPLLPGRIYDSNRYTLLSILTDHGYHLTTNMRFVPDDEKVMVESITLCLQDADVLITSGSVSIGGKDRLKPILKEHFNATIHFGRVNIKHGESTAFATCTVGLKKKSILCLPGNPVAAFVIMHVFGLPLLNKIREHRGEERIVRAKLASSYKLDARPEFVAAKLKWSDEDILPTATITGNEINGTVLCFKNANAILMLPASGEKDELQEGDVVKALLL